MAASKPTSWLSLYFHILYHLVYIWGPQLTVWALTLSTTDLLTRSLTAQMFSKVFGVCMCSVSCMPPSTNSALPPMIKSERCTSMHFGENQLSPALIGLSPLSTGHPNGFQPKLVRSSTASYRCFNLPMDRSTGFGSNASNYFALFRLGFPTATSIDLTSLDTITRRLIMQKARRHIINMLRPLVGR